LRVGARDLGGPLEERTESAASQNQAEENRDEQPEQCGTPRRAEPSLRREVAERESVVVLVECDGRALPRAGHQVREQSAVASVPPPPSTHRRMRSASSEVLGLVGVNTNISEPMAGASNVPVI